MRRFAVPFAVLYLGGASLWGQTPASIGALLRAEDSPNVFAGIGIPGSTPRGREPQAAEASGTVPAGTAPAGTVSVEALQHPLSHKGARLIRRAQQFSATGDHVKAIAELRLALNERSAIPYAHSLLGSEYLKLNQVPDALEALEQAVKLMPRSAINHSNLGYALYLLGDIERAAREVRRALELDHNNEKTRRVLSLIVQAGGNGP
jgi:tetratricopeptide (TPR) repeat protein